MTRHADRIKALLRLLRSNPGEAGFIRMMIAIELEAMKK